MWSRPPWVTDRPERSLSAVTSVVSRIGIARISTGSATVAIVVPASLYEAISPSEASTNPISWLPESPMNTRAGPTAAGCTG